MPDIIIGIDPGAKGGLAVIEGKSLVYAILRPDTTAGINAQISAINRTARSKGSQIYAFIENVHAMPKQGVSSMFSFGRDAGIWQGILAAYQIPVELVPPQKWQKIISGMAGRTTKQRSIRFAMAAFPDVCLIPKGHRTPQDGIADAVCIAWYGAAITEKRKGGSHHA